MIKLESVKIKGKWVKYTNQDWEGVIVKDHNGTFKSNNLRKFIKKSNNK